MLLETIKNLRGKLATMKFKLQQLQKHKVLVGLYSYSITREVHKVVNLTARQRHFSYRRFQSEFPIQINSIVLHACENGSGAVFRKMETNIGRCCLIFDSCFKKISRLDAV